MNSATLIGNLATDVNLKDVGEDLTVGNFLLAVDRPGKDAGTDFISITTWNGTAKACAQYLAKGKKVGVTGQIRTRRWEQDGENRYAVEVRASRVEFLSPRNTAGVELAHPPASEPSTPEPTDADIPF